MDGAVHCLLLAYLKREKLFEMTSYQMESSVRCALNRCMLAWHATGGTIPHPGRIPRTAEEMLEFVNSLSEDECIMFGRWYDHPCAWDDFLEIAEVNYDDR